MVKEKDPEGIANAILKLAEDKDYYKNVLKIFQKFLKIILGKMFAGL